MDRTSNRNDVQKQLRRMFGDLEVVDAKTPLRLQPEPVDVVGAVPKDPRNCVFARCAKRLFGSTAVIFWKTVAYVDLVGEDGVQRVERFWVPWTCRLQMERWDSGQPIKIHRAFIFKPPPPNMSSAGKKRNNKAYRKTPAGWNINAAAYARRSVALADARIALTEARLAEARASGKRQRISEALRRVKDAKGRRAQLHEKAIAAEEIAQSHRTRSTRSPRRPFGVDVRNGHGDYHFSE